MEVFLFWFLFSVLCGMMASKAGRSGFGYFLLAMIVSPLICFLLLVIIGKTNRDEPTPETHIKCPDCRELIIKDARVCKHCGCKLLPQETS